MNISSISPLPPACCPNLRRPFFSHRKIQIATSPIRRKSAIHSSFQTQYKTSSVEEDEKIFCANKVLFLDEMHSFLGNNNNTHRETDQESPLQVDRDREVIENKVHTGISSNMWWANLKATLGQRFNLDGISSAMTVMTRDRHLALPHISIKDIRWIDWVELEKRGFRGVVFDKDNTLTAPYSLSLWPSLEEGLDRCKAVFGHNVVVFSNSAGLYQYDADGSKARFLEESIGIHVIRHGAKKPGGSAEELEKYFGCPASLLVMIGDRHLTDMVYGNRNGFLTILTEPLSLVEEPFVVKQVRLLESSLVNYWHRRGLKPTCHNLLSEAIECVKIPSPP